MCTFRCVWQQRMDGRRPVLGNVRISRKFCLQFSYCFVRTPLPLKVGALSKTFIKFCPFRALLNTDYFLIIFLYFFAVSVFAFRNVECINPAQVATGCGNINFCEVRSCVLLPATFNVY